jgi:hypothetical protein
VLVLLLSKSKENIEFCSLLESIFMINLIVQSGYFTGTYEILRSNERSFKVKKTKNGASKNKILDR